MGYQDDDRNGGDRWRDRDQNWNRDRDYGRDPGRGGAQSHGGDDRGFFNRAGDEVRSWFGDDDAQRRREIDQRHWEQDQRMSGRRDNDGGRFESGPGSFGGGWGNQRGESWNRERPGTAGAGEPGGWRGVDMHDPHYSQWRQRQIEDLDRDYEEYRREHQSKFEQEFGSWRQKRQGQRHMLGNVGEHMEVVGSDGAHVGKVDKVRGDRIILAKRDPKAGGMHHSIPCGWVESVDGKVILNRTAEQATNSWRNEETGRALFERDERRGDSHGPHALDRSFSGTYGGRNED